jgi:hypothetical protein
MSKLFGGRTEKEKRQEREFEAMFAPLIKHQSEAQSYALGEGKETLADFESTLALPKDYWTKLISGDHDSMMETLGPEVGALENAYQNQARSNAEFNPRGGGEIAQNTALQSEKFRSIADMVSKIRPEAADSLSQIASLLANLGLGEINAGTGAGASAIGGLLSKRDQDFAQRSWRVNNINQQMQGIGGMLALI